eukprot:CAMPEP_0182598904 /NCGR_PEP_ID=MMETSP1324-20130603/89229_1 /TAXON_ID=236786 /ORGANISM="Florenciella sp., Strain RCC1587" /LENGTH=162 /DNA_ID=CAMNT_0024816769 /DNA_START=22 /DNA_END=510 /DNA_ORIENTATION=+
MKLLVSTLTVLLSVAAASADRAPLFVRGGGLPSFSLPTLSGVAECVPGACAGTGAGGVASACIMSPVLGVTEVKTSRAKGLLGASAAIVGIASSYNIISVSEDIAPVFDEAKDGEKVLNVKQLIKVLGIGLGLTVVTGGSFAAGFLFSLGKVSELGTSDESS